MMNKKMENENTTLPSEVINDGIKTIATRSTWMLGVLTLIILGLASFVFQYIGTDLEAGSLLWTAWVIAAILCFFYVILLLAYIQPLIVADFKDLVNESSTERLKKLVNHFRRLVFLFVVLAPTSMLIGFVLWFVTN